MTTASVIWVKNLTEIMSQGDEISPRGIKTMEVMAYQSTIDMNFPVVTVKERELGYKFMAAEAAWILSGDNRLSNIAPFSKDIGNFSDDGVSFFGAYGPRIMDQLQYVVKALATDQDTRQSVMTIWRPNPPQSKDIPCTTQVQWFIRHGHLHCIDTMRSSDLWLGWPYDVFSFTMLSGVVALRLRQAYGIHVDLGFLTLQAGSQHIYEKNWEAVTKIIEETEKVDPGPRFNVHVFDDEKHLIDTLWNLAHTQNGAADL